MIGCYDNDTIMIRMIGWYDNDMIMISMIGFELMIDEYVVASAHYHQINHNCIASI